MRISRWTSSLSVLAAASLIAVACGGSDSPDPEPTDAGDTAEAPDADAEEPADEQEAVSVGLVYDIGGRGDLSFNDSAAAGLDRAAAEFNLDVSELEPSEGGENRGELLRLLSQEGVSLIIGVGFAFDEAIGSAAPDFPDVHYGLVDGFIDALTAESNVVSLLFAEHEGSFLVGAAAALKSEANRIGFIGGVEMPLIQKFQAGFEAGARHVNPDIQIDVSYISQLPDFSGFADPASGREIALGMYGNGADVVYHAAGGSGAGLFEAAKEHSDASGSKVWAIGVDSDQYQTAPEELREFILTSMLKRVDVAVYDTIAAHVQGNFEGGYREFDLASDGVGYSTSGGFIDDIVSELEDLKEQIASGAITVPDTP